MIEDQGIPQIMAHPRVRVEDMVVICIMPYFESVTKCKVLDQISTIQCMPRSMVYIPIHF